jgi:hypothetical protein
MGSTPAFVFEFGEAKQENGGRLTWLLISELIKLVEIRAN